MPRTPTNVETGNFMLDLALLGGGSGEDVILRERRPAILTYYSPMVDYVLKTAAIPWYLLGWKYEAEKLDVRMVDGVQFTKGWKNIPTSVRLEIQSFHTLQIYAAKVLITARLQGLR
jgi:seipin